MRRGMAVAAALAVVVGSVLIVRQVQSEPEPHQPTRTVTGTSIPQGFPGPDSTGVPSGVALSAYTGDCAITEARTVISEVRITCDRLVVQAADVRIERSVLGRVDVDEDGASVVIEDSVIDGGDYPAAAIGYRDITLRRVEVRGGQTSVQCVDCTVEDSWLHSQMDPVGDQHEGAYLSNGGDNVILRRNTISCDPENNAEGGGCTGGAQIFGDFAPLSNYIFEGNYFTPTPGGFCASFGLNPGKPFGENPTRIVVRNNVFDKGPTGRCGEFGAVTSFPAGDPDSVWEGNTYSDGEPVEAA